MLCINNFWACNVFSWPGEKKNQNGCTLTLMGNNNFQGSSDNVMINEFVQWLNIKGLARERRDDKIQCNLFFCWEVH